MQNQSTVATTQVMSEHMNIDETTDPGQMITLISKDGEQLKVKKNVILMSGLIKEMLDEEDDEEEENEIPLPNVNLATLKKVVKYCEYHHKNPAEELERPLKGKIQDVICEWDNEFLKIDQSTLVELIMAANYLNIKDLLDLTCANVASMIKGKTPQQIREMFGIENDFTPEEEAKILEENKWCEEA